MTHFLFYSCCHYYASMTTVSCVKLLQEMQTNYLQVLLSSPSAIKFCEMHSCLSMLLANYILKALELHLKVYWKRSKLPLFDWNGRLFYVYFLYNEVKVRYLWLWYFLARAVIRQLISYLIEIFDSPYCICLTRP